MDLKIYKDIPPWDWPDSAGETFLDTLRDDRAAPADRLLAAELAGDLTVIDDELADVLLSIVRSSDQSGPLRAKAAISLGPVLEEADMDGFEFPDDVPITKETFNKIRESLRSVFVDTAVPKDVRRRVLEASVRAPEDWHRDATSEAYANNDKDWKLTAVFCMRWVRGFDSQILEALKSSDHQIHYEAVCAAGAWGLDAAWPHISALLNEKTDKPLLLAAIEAVSNIRPREAVEILADLADSDDEEIAEAANEAIAMAQGQADVEEENGDDSLD